MVDKVRLSPAETSPTRKNIANFRQNKLHHIVADLAYRVCNENKIYEVLLGRGVFKWFAVRRDLIRLKNRWKEEIIRISNILTDTKIEQYYDGDGHVDYANYMKDKYYFKGYRAALEECRRDIRALCHSDRWQSPDNDQEASRWLAQRTVNQASIGIGATIPTHTPPNAEDVAKTA